MGVINLDTQNVLSRFTKDDLDLLMAVAGQAALSYESARLLTSHMEKLKQDSEIAIAKNVQQALLPKTLPQVAGYDFFASYDTALAVGGDYYDAMLLDDGESLPVVRRRGGEGDARLARDVAYFQRRPAARSNTSTTSARRSRRSTTTCARAPSRDGSSRTSWRIVDTRSHEMRLVDRRPHVAHDPQAPTARSKNSTRNRSASRSACWKITRSTSCRARFSPGETVLFYTDGVSEAMNPKGELYGDKRVREFLRNSHGTAAEIGKALLADVRTHANGRDAERRHHDHGLRPQRLASKRSQRCSPGLRTFGRIAVRVPVAGQITEFIERRPRRTAGDDSR